MARLNSMRKTLHIGMQGIPSLHSTKPQFFPVSADSEWPCIRACSILPELHVRVEAVRDCRLVLLACVDGFIGLDICLEQAARQAWPWRIGTMIFIVGTVMSTPGMPKLHRRSSVSTFARRFKLHHTWKLVIRHIISSGKPGLLSSNPIVKF